MSVLRRVWWFSAVLAVPVCGAWIIYVEHGRAARLEPLWADVHTAAPATGEAALAEPFQGLPVVVGIDEPGERAVLAWPGRSAAIATVGQRSPDGALQLTEVHADTVILRRTRPQRGQLRLHRQDLGRPAEWVSFDLPTQTIDRLVLLPMHAAADSLDSSRDEIALAPQAQTSTESPSEPIERQTPEPSHRGVQ